MPMRAPRICSCGHRVPAGQRCACQERARAEADKRRPSASARGYTARWQRESKEWLQQAQNKFCACGCGRLANVVDHIIPHRGDYALFWNKKNWQPMHSRCHNSRKQRQERQGVFEPMGVVRLFSESSQ